MPNYWTSENKKEIQGIYFDIEAELKLKNIRCPKHQDRLDEKMVILNWRYKQRKVWYCEKCNEVYELQLVPTKWYSKKQVIERLKEQEEYKDN